MGGSKAGASVVCVVLIVFLDKNLIFQREFLNLCLGKHMSISNALLYQRSCGKRMSWRSSWKKRRSDPRLCLTSWRQT